MKLNTVSQKSSSITTGYLIFCALSIVSFALIFGDPMFIVFAIPILLIFILAASVGKGSATQDLESVGWSDKNLSTGIPLGIIGGIVGVFIGGLFIKITSVSTTYLVPDMSAIAFVVTSSVIPPSLALSANILAQWLVVAPSEESAYRVLAPYAGLITFKNTVIAYIVASILWVATHIPAYTMQNAPQSMYMVLIIFSVITIGLVLFTGNVISAIVAHGTFNTLILLLSNNIDMMAITIVSSIAITLFYLSRGKK